jgi:hypothetical protein
LAIVRTVLWCEGQSSIWVDRRGPVLTTIDFERKENRESWASAFATGLFSGCGVDQLADRLSNLVLIVFNYDRCVEHYLFRSLVNYYEIGHDRAAELMRHIPIYHPYGKIGNLPWENREPSIEFGSEVRATELLTLAEGIYTFSESVGSALEAEIREHVATCEKLIFLGFAFHKQNMELLKASKPSLHAHSCYATALGFSSPDISEITKDIASLFAPGSHSGLEPFEVEDLSCADLLREYSRSLRW